MKKMLCLLALLAINATSYASILFQYDAGVNAQIGATGAADPTTQGWTKVAGGGQWNDAFDIGDGGWMIEDGTNRATTYYERTLTSGQQSVMASSWTMTSTFSMLSDLTGQDGTFLDNWHQDNNNSSGMGFWIENGSAGYHYWIRFSVDADNLFVYDGTNTHQLTTDGSGYDVFKTYTINYDGTDAVLSVDGNDYALDSHGPGSQDRFIFGLASSTMYGSAVFNEVTVVPEPATIALLVMGGLTAIRRRRS
ncbi:MAG: PEP-CTERM sorting domain-containing protein [Phycisphaerae bacterium]|nr:PEP-CTERM sorting domain-containing protein [Phycisphaerae bacterium]